MEKRPSPTASTAAAAAAAANVDPVNSESDDNDNNSDIMSVSDGNSDTESDVDPNDYNQPLAKRATTGIDEEDDDDEDNEDNEDNEEEVDNEPTTDALTNEFGHEEEVDDHAADSDEEEGDEEEDENCLQKLDDVTRQNLIADYHPETITHPAAEIQCWACVTRDKYGDIVDELHQTTAILSKFERTRVLGLRTRQLNAGALPFIDVPRSIISNYLIATMELEQKKLPFIIQRPLPNGRFEYWNVNDLELI